MRNILICFFAMLFFAPADLFAATPSRIANHTESAPNTTRAASVRGTTRSAINSTTSRSDKITSRSGEAASHTADTTIRTTTPRVANVSGRSGITTRTLEVNRTNVKQRGSTLNRILNAANDVVDRNVSSRAAIVSSSKNTEKKVSAADVAAAQELLEQTASLNKSCQEQYNECMDQFCAVVDANQKRCSCSANLSKYANVQNAVTNANNELNSVAQRIRYVGLSADEIRAIMTETEAEAELDNSRDTSETRSMLSKIESLIQDPTTRVTTSGGDSDFGLDIDLDFSNTDADIFSLDFLNTNNDSISSKRGTALYNAAKKRCRVILNNCTDVGATSNQITGNYDLAIDKDCIAYEQGLKKMNETLQSNVRSAGLMLQKARLAVLQNKNQYDAKGCIGVLETCMTDDMVCGSDYAKCLDPTKKYIDENGKVVLGQDITNITDFMAGFNNANINAEMLSAATSATINDTYCKQNNDGSCVVKYLLSKIGTGATVKDGGLCRAVLDKCQQYTYNLSGDKYNPYNDVVVNYVQRAMVNIKSAQHQIISDYASSCMTDVAACYNQQVTQVNSWSSVASVSSIRGVMTGACRNVALTCAYAVFANMCDAGMNNAINWVLQSTESSTQTTDGDNCTPCDASHPDKCINGISEIFYQSLLCPENSEYTINTGTPSNYMLGGYVNKQCKCIDGYTVFNGACLQTCPQSKYRDEYGSCKECDTGLSPTGGSSTKENTGCQTSSNVYSTTSTENT